MNARESPKWTSANPEPSPSLIGRCRRLLREADAVDKAVYEAVARTATPTLDGPMTFISNAANFSGIWLLAAGFLALLGGRAGQRAAMRGLTAIGAASASANLAAKHMFRRTRPTRSPINEGRRAAMPSSSSFPSGHTASAFAFAAAVAAELPSLGLPLYGLATAVGYSRVHSGVHYPGDVMGGAVLGLAVGSAVGRPHLLPGQPGGRCD